MDSTDRPFASPPPDDNAASEGRYRALFNAMDEGFCILEMVCDAEGAFCDYRFLEVNPVFEQHTGLVDAVGKTAYELIPTLEPYWVETYGNVVRTGQSLRFSQGSEVMGRWFDVYAFRLGEPDSRQVAVIFNDVSARRQTEAALQASEQRSRHILESITDGFFALDSEWRYTFVNSQAERLLDRSYQDLVGKCVWDEYPGLSGSDFERAFRRAAEAKEASSLTQFYPDHDRWYESRVYPATDGITVYFRDVTERQRDQETVRMSEERFRTLFESMSQGVVFHDGATRQLIGANLAAERILGISLDEMLGRDARGSEWDMVRDDGTPLPLSEFPSARAMLTGQATYGQIVGVYNPRLRQYRYIQVTAVPQFRPGEAKPFLVYSLFDDITEQRELERERARLYAETRAQNIRERLINQIGQTARDSSLSPEEVQERTAALIGQALNLDRCYFTVHDPVRNTLLVGGDWHRPDLPPISGRRSGTDYAEMSREFYPDGTTSAVYRDVRDAPFGPANHKRFAYLGFRAMVGVAFREQRDRPVAASMAAAMVNGPRDWTQAEVELLEAAGTLVWSSLETQRRQQRERHIATQLQDALIPPRPPVLAGLDLASHYQPALDEAGVGGDFYDVFAVEKGGTALVVADLSGKGLAAAQQVAMVRNMLRFALFTSESLAGGLNRLNRTLVEHHQLTGFATLFAGIYDHGARTLTYVNCGQEPGLVWRAASDSVEMLPATGPVLGGFDTTAYEQQSVTLAPGDVLALFTDGLTEVGPTRRQQLEAAGVADLLKNCLRTTGHTAENITAQLVAGVNVFSQNGVRDDVALLVGVVR